jgi:hypothetical protein
MFRNAINYLDPTRRRERISIRRSSQPRSNRILFDVSLARLELFETAYLNLIESSFPNLSFALQPKRESSLDKLQGFFERRIWRRCKKKVHVVRHYDECMQREPTLFAVVLKNVDHQIGGTLQLEQATTVGRHSRNEIRAHFLRCESHSGRIRSPGLKACVARHTYSWA